MLLVKLIFDTRWGLLYCLLHFMGFPYFCDFPVLGIGLLIYQLMIIHSLLKMVISFLLVLFIVSCTLIIVLVSE